MGWYHPMAFAYAYDAEHEGDDDAEMEPDEAPPGGDDSCERDDSCPAPAYYEDGELAGGGDLGFGDYEDAFRRPKGAWRASAYHAELTLAGDYDGDLFYYCYVRGSAFTRDFDRENEGTPTRLVGPRRHVGPHQGPRGWRQGPGGRRAAPAGRLLQGPVRLRRVVRRLRPRGLPGLGRPLRARDLPLHGRRAPEGLLRRLPDRDGLRDGLRDAIIPASAFLSRAPPEPPVRPSFCRARRPSPPSVRLSFARAALGSPRRSGARRSRTTRRRPSCTR